MRIETEIKLDYKDVLFRPKRSVLSSRSQVELIKSFKFKHSGQNWSGIPIVAANMDSVGTFATAKALRSIQSLTCLHKFYNINEIISFFEDKTMLDYTAVSSGITEEDLTDLYKVLSLVPNIKFICLDVANGYSEKFVDVVERVRNDHPNKVIIAGNVVSGEMTEELILKGADVIKTGIGGGSVCTTRIQTGVGYPQLSAVIECADAAHGVGGHVMADGGCVVPGDVAKAFGAGADFVMLGGMLAGHNESAGEIIEEDGKKYKSFYGMSSEAAMKKYYGKVANYRSSEGKLVKVPYRGAILDTIQNILGGIRSTCTYIGARTLKDMPKCTTFIRVTQQSNEVFGKNS
jgi:GMP reductase